MNLSVYKKVSIFRKLASSDPLSKEGVCGGDQNSTESCSTNERPTSHQSEDDDNGAVKDAEAIDPSISISSEEEEEVEEEEPILKSAKTSQPLKSRDSGKLHLKSFDQ